MDKVLISACFLGLNVRYNGKTKPLHLGIIEKWQKQGRFVVVCPEVAGGLAVPREPAEIQNNGQVITQTNANVTQAFHNGAAHALYLCSQHQIRYALMKESSPSCGSNTIYDGTFSGTKVNGVGVTAQLLTKNGIQVFSEDNIEELVDLIERA